MVMKRLKTRNNIAIALLLFTMICCFSSCKSRLERKVAGIWAIDTFTMGKVDMRFEMYGVMLTFNDDNTCNLPTSVNLREDCCKWRYQGGNQVMISGKKSIPEGIYTIEVIEIGDTLRMVMKNDSVYIATTRLW